MPQNIFTFIFRFFSLRAVIYKIKYERLRLNNTLKFGWQPDQFR